MTDPILTRLNWPKINQNEDPKPKHIEHEGKYKKSKSLKKNRLDTKTNEEQ